MRFLIAGIIATLLMAPSSWGADCSVRVLLAGLADQDNDLGPVVDSFPPELLALFSTALPSSGGHLTPPHHLHVFEDSQEAQAFLRKVRSKMPGIVATKTPYYFWASLAGLGLSISTLVLEIMMPARSYYGGCTLIVASGTFTVSHYIQCRQPRFRNGAPQNRGAIAEEMGEHLAFWNGLPPGGRVVHWRVRELGAAQPSDVLLMTYLGADSRPRTVFAVYHHFP